MNYLILKNIIATLMKNFRCPNCQLWKPKDENLDIHSISKGGLEVSFLCSQCQKKTILKAETSKIPEDFLQTPFGKKLFQKMSRENNNSFSAEEIEQLQEKLKKSITIKDFIDG